MTRAKVEVEGAIVGAIERGHCVFVGVARGDDAATGRDLATKVVGLRVFDDDDGKMNRSLLDVGGALLAVSQFTLLGDVRKGRRPSFIEAMPPETAEPLFDAFCAACRSLGAHVESGRFRTDMQVELVNDGPVTILIDSERTF